MIGPISFEAKQTGERNARNWHVAFDAAGAGNVAWSRCCDTRRRKSELTGNTNFDLNRRASLRPYQLGPARCDLRQQSIPLCRSNPTSPHSALGPPVPQMPV